MDSLGSSVLNMWLFFVIITVFLSQIQNLAWLVGLLSGAIWSVLNMFCYVWASSSTIQNLAWLLTSMLILWVIIKIYQAFKPWN